MNDLITAEKYTTAVANLCARITTLPQLLAKPPGLPIGITEFCYMYKFSSASSKIAFNICTGKLGSSSHRDPIVVDAGESDGIWEAVYYGLINIVRDDFVSLSINRNSRFVIRGCINSPEELVKIKGSAVGDVYIDSGSHEAFVFTDDKWVCVGQSNFDQTTPYNTRDYFRSLMFTTMIQCGADEDPEVVRQKYLEYMKVTYNIRLPKELVEVSPFITSPDLRTDVKFCKTEYTVHNKDNGIKMPFEGYGTRKYEVRNDY